MRRIGAAERALEAGLARVEAARLRTGRGGVARKARHCT